MLTRQQIRAIIEAQGYNAYFRENLSGKGDGVSKIYVRFAKYSSKVRQSIVVDLGRIETVQQMGEGQLAETLTQKFAEKLNAKMRVTNKG